MALTAPHAGDPGDPDELAEASGLELRRSEYGLLFEGRRVGLTVREFEIFLVLAERPDRVVTRPDIYRMVWGGEMPRRDRSVDVFVRKLRTKLDRAAPGWVFIHTHWGIGYRFAPERAAARSAPATAPRAPSSPTR